MAVLFKTSFSPTAGLASPIVEIVAGGFETSFSPTAGLAFAIELLVPRQLSLRQLAWLLYF